MTTLHLGDCLNGCAVCSDRHHEAQRYERDNCSDCGHDLLEVRVYTQCFNCDHEAEFNGRIGEYDTAKFPCPSCGEDFEMSDFSTRFNEEVEA